MKENENPSDAELLDWLNTRANCTLWEEIRRRWTVRLDAGSDLMEFSGETPREALTKGFIAYHAARKEAP